MTDLLPPDARSVVRLVLDGACSAITSADLRALGDGLELLIGAAEWGARPSLPQLDSAADAVEWPIPLDLGDRRRTWRELCQAVALARVLSALRPDWVVTVQDGTGLWSHSPEAPNPLVLRGGSATRPRHGGPPSPAADRDLALHRVLWSALGASLAERWGVRPPPPEPETPTAPTEAAPEGPSRPRKAAPQAAAPVQGFDAVLLSAVVRADGAAGPTLELELDLANRSDEVLQDVAALVVLRGADDAPIGAAELDLPALAPRERRTLRRSEPLVHAPDDLFAVEVQVHATAMVRVHGTASVSGGSS